jgi:hypothetical protein
MAKKESKLQQARVLGGFTLDGLDYNPNDIIESTPEMIKSLGSSVDADPAAVRFCLAAAKNPIMKKYEPANPEPVQDEEQADQDETTETTEATETTETTNS